MSGMPVAFVCPSCKGELRQSVSAYACDRCARQFPIVTGIVDFRLVADPWISIEDDRAKGLRLEDATRDADFASTVRAYWTMTPTTPAPVAARFVDHVLAATPRTREWLDAVTRDAPVPAGVWLDLGCGTADMAEAAPEGQAVVGIDVAFRWLIAARARLHAAGRPAWLVCCNAEHLPFPARAFSRVLSLGVLEHSADPRPVFREAARVLLSGGQLAMRAVNRYSLLPEPHVGVWGVGLVPRRWADAYVHWRSGQRYQHHRPPSVRELRAAARQAGLTAIRVCAARLLPQERARLGVLGRLAPAYDLLSRLPVAGRAITWVAPLVDTSGRAA
jgi:ubiquinone/menaquinone biosynthesis C-methylase UbiE